MIDALKAEVLDALRCPVCGMALSSTEAGLRCGSGHAFDRARQGYVNLLLGQAASSGDGASMIAARVDWLGSGQYQPLATALAECAAQYCRDGLLVDAGAGTGYYLANVLERLPGCVGLAMDVSKYAARRAAKAHSRVVSIVADTMATLPLADDSASLVLNLFAPRNAPEFRRILPSDGVLIVVTPTPEHLGELRSRIELVDIHPDKEERLAAAIDPLFEREPAQVQTWTMQLSHEDVRRVVSMGPSAFHLDERALAAQVASLPEPFSVTASVSLHVCRPRPVV